MTGERIGISANTSNKAWIDISARDFWISTQNVPEFKMFQANKKEKKSMYKERMLKIDKGSISPMMFVVNGVMGLECDTVFSRIAESISMKNGIPKSVVTNSLHTKISFSLFRTMSTFVRGLQS